MTPRQHLHNARAAYLAEDLLGEHLSDTGVEILAHLDCIVTGTQGYIAKTPSGKIIIAFRGTEITSLKDLKTDLDWRHVRSHHGGYTHRGFTLATKSIVDQVITVVANFTGDIYITGHSLGAAIATLIAMDIEAVDAGRIKSIHTFGSPRVGCPIFAAAYDLSLKDRTYRHLNCCDAVARVPSAWQGYCHVGQLRYYDAFGHQHEGTSLLLRIWNQIQARSMSWVAGESPLKGTRGIRDHRLDSYLKVVR